MVGELPGDFLRIGCTAQQQQSLADERVAQILQAQQQAGYTVMPSNIKGRLSITVAQVRVYFYTCISLSQFLLLILRKKHF